jgi:hypothetical protein
MRVRKIAKRDHSLRHVRPSAGNDSAPIDEILMKFDTEAFLKNLSRKLSLIKIRNE